MLFLKRRERRGEIIWPPDERESSKVFDDV